MQTVLSKYFKGDPVIWRIIGIFSIFSVLAVFSSTGSLAFKYQGGDVLHYVVKHTSLLLAGIGTMALFSRINYKVYFRFAVLGIWFTVPLLLFTLTQGGLNSASRWVFLPGGLSFQTSDLAKIALIIYLAKHLAKHQENLHNYKKVLFPALGVIFTVCGLIFPANFSTAALLFAVSIGILFVGRIPIKQLLLTLIGISFGAFLLGLTIFHFPDIFPRGNTWKARIETFISGEPDPDQAYQGTQAVIGVANGGILGKGPGNGTQRNFLPHPYSDFIYVIIVEEYGVWGGLIVLSLYLFLLYRAGVIMGKCEYAFPALLTMGIMFLIVFQALVNMGVAVQLLPVTGQTLPFISMGGTSLLFTGAAFGMVLNVSKTVREEQEKKEKKTKRKAKSNPLVDEEKPEDINTEEAKA